MTIFSGSPSEANPLARLTDKARMRLDFDPVDRAEPPDMPPHLRNGDLTHLMLRIRLSATAV
jgi:hypothetical protein